ncbi:MAG: sporulation integral membrane protein YtvI [Acutalibacteraceae bacterium]|nr:sporulation integral membrane protein YtvI [Acutalibacteraceae bacterium]
MNNERKKKFLIYVAYVGVIIGLLYFLLRFCLAYLLPFAIGTLIALAVQKPALYIHSKIKLSKGTTALLLVIFIYFLLIVLIGIIGSRVYVFAADFTHRTPGIIEKLSLSIKQFSEKISEMTQGSQGEYLSSAVYSFFQKFVDKISDAISAFFTQFATLLPGLILSIFVTAITGCYIAKDFEKLKENACLALGEENTLKIKKIWTITVKNVFGLAKGYLILSFIAFVELAVGFLLIKVKNAVKIAFLVAIVDMLPVLGSGTVLLPWVMVCMFNGNTAKAVGLAVIYVVVTVVRNVMEPKIMSKQVGLHPVIALLSIVLGLKIFGFAGLIAVPVIVTVGYHYIAEKVTEND